MLTEKYIANHLMLFARNGSERSPAQPQSRESNVCQELEAAREETIQWRARSPLIAAFNDISRGESKTCGRLDDNRSPSAGQASLLLRLRGPENILFIFSFSFGSRTRLFLSEPDLWSARYIRVHNLALPLALHRLSNESNRIAIKKL